MMIDVCQISIDSLSQNACSFEKVICLPVDVHVQMSAQANTCMRIIAIAAFGDDQFHRVQFLSRLPTQMCAWLKKYMMWAVEEFANYWSEYLLFAEILHQLFYLFFSRCAEFILHPCFACLPTLGRIWKRSFIVVVVAFVRVNWGTAFIHNANNKKTKCLVTYKKVCFVDHVWFLYLIQCDRAEFV